MVINTMQRQTDESNDPCFEQDMQRIQKGYRMLDDIENKLKCYLDKGDLSSADGETRKDARYIDYY